MITSVGLFALEWSYWLADGTSYLSMFTSSLLYYALYEFASLEAIIDIFSAVIIESFGMFTDYVFQLFVNSVI